MVRRSRYVRRTLRRLARRGMFSDPVGQVGRRLSCLGSLIDLAILLGMFVCMAGYILAVQRARQTSFLLGLSERGVELLFVVGFVIVMIGVLVGAKALRRVLWLFLLRK